MNRGAWGEQLTPKEAEWARTRLASFRLFSDIPKEEIAYTVERSFFLEAGPDRVVVFKGTMYGEVFVLLDGKAIEEGARVQVGDSIHDFSWIRRTLGPGDTFGELPGKLQHPQPYTVVIKEKGIATHNVMILPAEVLGDIIERHADFATRLYREDVAARLRTIPAFQNIPNLDLRYLALAVREERLARGTELPERYPETQSLWIVNQGRVAAFEFPRHGSKNAPGPDHYLSAGQVFVLSESPVGEPLHLYKAVMETDASLFRVPFDQLKNLHGKTLYGKDLSTSLEYVDPASELAEMSRRNGRCVLGLGFDKRSPRFLKVLSGYIGWEYVPQWEEVVVQGERANKLYVLRKGEALVKATDKSGRERPRSYLPDPVFRKCHFGLKSILYTGEHSVTVEATKHSEWFSLAHEDFVQLGRDLDGDLKKEYDEWKTTLIAGRDAEESDQEQTSQKNSRAVDQAFDWLRKQIIPDQDYCYDKIKLSPGEAPKFCRWKHWWIYIKRVSLIIMAITIGLGLITALIAKGSGSLSWNGILWLLPQALLTEFVLSAAVAFLVARDFLNDFLVVTNQRIVSRDQVLLFGIIPVREASQEIPIQHVQDVKTFTVGIVRRLLDVGNIYIQSAATAGTIIFDNIGHPNEVRERILQISMRTQRIRIAKYKESLKRDIKEKVLNLLSPTAPRTALPHRPLVPRSRGRSRMTRLLLSMKKRTEKAQRFLKGLVRYLFRRRPEPYSAARKSRPTTREVKWRHLFFTLSWQEGDRIVWRKHWIRLYQAIAMPVLLFLLLATAALYFLFYAPPIGSRTQVAGLFALLFLADAFFFFVKYQNWSNDQYILDKTTLHDINKGPLSIKVSDVITPLSRIQNVDVKIDSWKAKVLGYGTIRVSTAAERGEATFDYIPHPYQVRDLIMQRIWELAEAQEQKRAEEDRKRLTTTIGLYEELKEKSRPTPPRVWHKPYKPEEPEE